jgi:hypothetical protein
MYYAHLDMRTGRPKIPRKSPAIEVRPGLPADVHLVSQRIMLSHPEKRTQVARPEAYEGNFDPVPLMVIWEVKQPAAIARAGARCGFEQCHGIL